MPGKLQNFLRSIGRKSLRPAASNRHRIRPELFVLEQREVPATLTVTGALDGPGLVTMTGSGTYSATTLRAAVDFANSSTEADLIEFDSSLSGQDVMLVTNDTNYPYGFGPTALLIVSQITIDGGDSNITLMADSQRRLFGVLGWGNLTLKNLTLQFGNARGGDGGNASPPVLGAAGFGGGAGGGGAGLGGALIATGGTVTIDNCTFSDNVAQGGLGGSLVGLANETVGSGGGASAIFAGGSASTQTTIGGSGGGGVNGPGVSADGTKGGSGGANQQNQQAGADATPQMGGGGGGGSASFSEYFGVNHSGAPATSVNWAGIGGGGGGGGNGNGMWGDGRGGQGGFGGGGGGGGIGSGGNGGFGGGGGGAGGNQASPTHPIAGTPGISKYGGGTGGKSQFIENDSVYYFGGGGGGGMGAGGAIFVQYCSLTITNSTITGNSAIGGSGGSATSYGGQAGAAGNGVGAGVFALNSMVSITDSTISGNTNSTPGYAEFIQIIITPTESAQGTQVRSGSPQRFVDDDGDVYRVRLVGPGTATVFLDDMDGDGKGPIAGIVLEGTTAKSQLRIDVPRNSRGDRQINVASIAGQTIGMIHAPHATVTDSGIRMSGSIGKLAIGNVRGEISARAIDSALVLGDVNRGVWSLSGVGRSTLRSIQVNGTFSNSLILASQIGSVRFRHVEAMNGQAGIESKGSIRKISARSLRFVARDVKPSSTPLQVGTLTVYVTPEGADRSR